MRGAGPAAWMAASIAAATALVGAPGAAARPLETVIQDDTLLLYPPRQEVDGTVRRLRALGVDRVRITASWSALAPSPGSRKRPRFDARDSYRYPIGGFARLDKAVSAVAAAGLQPMVDLSFWAPRWAVPRVDARRPEWHRYAPSARAYGDFARAVVSRYDGRHPDPTDLRRMLPRVRTWTTWNEPNFPDFLSPQWLPYRRGWRMVAPDVYRAMHEAAFREIKRVDPGSTVLAGGLASGGAFKPGRYGGIAPLAFLRALVCVDNRLRPTRSFGCKRFRPLHADGFAYHPYTGGVSPAARDPEHPDSVIFGELPRLTGLLERLRRRGRIARRLPVYLTEFGYETDPPDPSGASPDQAARYLGQATYLAWRNPAVRTFAQFLVRDERPDPARAFDVGAAEGWQSGLLDADGREKPSWTSFELPFWAQPARNARGVGGMFAFGQVRPRGGPHLVRVEVQQDDGSWVPAASLPATSAGGRPVDEFQTSPSGYFERFVPRAREGRYRFTWLTRFGPPQVSLDLGLGEPQRRGRPVAALVRPRRR